LGLDGSLRVVVIKVDIVVDADKIFNYAKDGSIDTTFTESTVKELKKVIKRQLVLAQLDISLIDDKDNIITEYEGIYKIRIFIPEEIRQRENMQIVFISDNEIEVFDITRDGNWISFETDHFSDFYLLGDLIETDEEYKVINLWWLIILLSVLAILLAIAILFKRKDNARKQKQVSAYLFPILVIIIPFNAYLIIWILVAINIVLIAYLVYLFLVNKLKKEDDDDEKLE